MALILQTLVLAIEKLDFDAEAKLIFDALDEGSECT